MARYPKRAQGMPNYRHKSAAQITKDLGKVLHALQTLPVESKFR